MSIHECGTRWRSLSRIFSIDESVWWFDDGVGNGKNEDADGKIFSFDIVSSFEFAIADRD
jgi:hypothetical protein